GGGPRTGPGAAGAGDRGGAETSTGTAPARAFGTSTEARVSIAARTGDVQYPAAPPHKLPITAASSDFFSTPHLLKSTAARFGPVAVMTIACVRSPNCG